MLWLFKYVISYKWANRVIDLVTPLLINKAMWSYQVPSWVDLTNSNLWHRQVWGEKCLDHISWSTGPFFCRETRWMVGPFTRYKIADRSFLHLYHNSDASQTDWQTDGRTDRQTYLRSPIPHCIQCSTIQNIITMKSLSCFTWSTIFQPAKLVCLLMPAHFVDKTQKLVSKNTQYLPVTLWLQKFYDIFRDYGIIGLPLHTKGKDKCITGKKWQNEKDCT